MNKNKTLEIKDSGIILPKIMIVDDDEQIRKQIQWALSGEFHVHSAGDRPTAIEIFKKENVPAQH